MANGSSRPSCDLDLQWLDMMAGVVEPLLCLLIIATVSISILPNISSLIYNMAYELQQRCRTLHPLHEKAFTKDFYIVHLRRIHVQVTTIQVGFDRGFVQIFSKMLQCIQDVIRSSHFAFAKSVLVPLI